MNNRKTFSWGLSILAHTVLAVVVVRAGLQYALPEGAVSADNLNFETFHSPKGVQTETPTKAQKEDVPVIKSKPKVKPLPMLPLKTSDTTAPEVQPAEKAVEEPEQAQLAPPADTESPITESPPIAEATPEAAPQTSASETPLQSSELPESTAPKFGTPGSMLDESKLTEMPGNKKPNYPWMARLRRQEGTVTVAAYIKANGQVDLPLVYKSSGSPLLDREVVDSYHKWKYKPGRAGWVIKSFNFRLTN